MIPDSLLRRKQPPPVKHKAPLPPVSAGGNDDLPPGWVRVESRSKPGAFFYAHPATKRTQVERPTWKRPRVSVPAQSSAVAAAVATHGRARQAAGPQPPPRGATVAAEAAPLSTGGGGRDGVVDLDSPVDDAEAAEARRRAAEEKAEAEERARAEAFQRARERKVREQQAQKELRADAADEEEGQAADEVPDAKGDPGTSPPAPVPVAKSPGAAPRRPVLAAATADPVAGGMRKRRRQWRKEESSDGDGDVVTKEDLERWRLDEELREDQEEADAASSPAEGATPQETAAEHGEDKDGGASPLVGEDGDPCLDVMKDGAWIERHVLSSTKKRWLLGRAAASVDISMQHESISRQHAALIRRGEKVYIADLGSAHGTTLNGKRLEKETPVALKASDELVFGASTRTYIFRDEGH